MKRWLHLKLESIFLSTNSHLFPRKVKNRGAAQLIIRVSEYLVRWISSRVSPRISLHKLKRAKNINSSVPILVLGSGPSVQNLDFSKIQKLRSGGKLKVMAINNYIGSNFETLLGFDFYLLSDPAYNLGGINPIDELELTRVKEVWKSLSQDDKVLVFVPDTWKKIETQLGETRVFGFNDRPLHPVSKNISPVRPRGYKSLTLLKALAVALHLSDGEIFVVGADETQFKGFRVGEDNSIQVGPNHAKGTHPSGKEANQTYLYPNGVMDLFFNQAQTAHHYVSRFGRTGRITNLNPESFVDAFPKADPLGIYKTK